MAQPTAEPTRVTPTWMYVNDARIAFMLLGVACVVLGFGLLLFLSYGAEHLETVDALLGVGIFLTLFCLLLIVPRFRSRGPTSYSLLVERPMDEVEDTVRKAIEETGRKAHIEVTPSRLQHPPRAVFADGLAWRFSVRAAPYRERREEGTSWTELVQCGFRSGEDESARELRELVLVRLTALEGSAI